MAKDIFGAKDLLDQKLKSGSLWNESPEETYGSRLYSFADAHIEVMIPFSTPGTSPRVRLPGLTLFSLSGHRDKFPVVSAGVRDIKGFTRGHRTIAGSMGFVTGTRDPLSTAILRYANYIKSSRYPTFILPDELPPFDIVVTFVPEHSALVIGGSPLSQQVIHGVEIVDWARNVSVRDVEITEMYSFIAKGATQLVELEPLQESSRENTTSAVSNVIPKQKDFVSEVSPPIVLVG